MYIFKYNSCIKYQNSKYIPKMFLVLNIFHRCIQSLVFKYNRCIECPSLDLSVKSDQLVFLFLTQAVSYLCLH